MKQALKIGLIGSVISVLLALIGMVEAFSQRDIINEVISMGHTLLLLMGSSSPILRPGEHLQK